MGEVFVDYLWLYVDFSGYGGLVVISVDGFDDVIDLLCKILVSYNIFDFWLVGYLFGGWVVMMVVC